MGPFYRRGPTPVAAAVAFARLFYRRGPTPVAAAVAFARLFLTPEIKDIDMD